MIVLGEPLDRHGHGFMTGEMNLARSEGVVWRFLLAGTQNSLSVPGMHRQGEASR